jgi:hypothetical protein
MQFLLGALAAAAFFVVLVIVYTLGQVNGQKHKPDPIEFELDDEEAELQEQRERAKRLKKGFDEMMAYNEAKARKG